MSISDVREVIGKLNLLLYISPFVGQLREHNVEFADHNKPLIFAHRGAHAVEPENSLEAFQLALEMGCDGIELDVRLTANEEFVVFHDRRLKRMTGDRNRVDKVSSQYLEQLNLNGDPEAKIPSLEEVLELIRDRAWLNLEIKPRLFHKNGALNRLIGVLRNFGLKETVIVSSFNFKILKEFHQLAPEYHLGFIYRHRIYAAFIDTTILSSLHPHHHLVNAQYLENAWRKGLNVLAWTVDKEKTIRRMISLGVDGIITDNPELALELKRSLRPERTPVHTE